MASASTAMVDPTKPGRYPIVLGDSILNRSNPKQILTGIRYNHKPVLSTPTAPTSARLKPAPSSQQSAGNAQSFDMSFNDDGGKYVYQGQRTTDSSQVVLIFDPARQVLVMERVDSLFHLNLAATPSNQDAESLRQEFPHLEISKSQTPVKVEGALAPPKKTAAPKKKAEKASGTKKAGPRKGKAAKEKAVDAAESANTSSAMDMALPSKPPTPPPASKKAKPKKPDPDSEEDEDSDDDLGLTIEFPGGKPSQPGFGVNNSINMAGGAAIGTRRFEDILQGHDDDDAGGDDGLDDFNFEDDDGDADGEDDGKSVVSDAPRLPPPVGQAPPQQGYQTQAQPQHQQYYAQEQESDEDDAGAGLEDDYALEAELLNALDEVEEDSDVSEEE